MPAPRMATRKTFQPEPPTAEQAVFLNGFDEKLRTGRLEPASRTRPAKPRKHGRQEPLVAPDEQSDDPHQAGSLNNPARVASPRHSDRSASNSAPAARCRAMSTSQRSSKNSGRSARTNSRSRRRTRLRTTAGPTRREVMIPTRETACTGAASSTLKTMNLP